jgi:hypothetical protein
MARISTDIYSTVSIYIYDLYGSVPVPWYRFLPISSFMFELEMLGDTFTDSHMVLTRTGVFGSGRILI